MADSKKFQTLGNSDINISRVGLGCMGLSEFYGDPTSEADATKLIHHALECGVNFFDTADMYGAGHNEKLLAAALKDRRDKAVIATKFGIVREGSEYSREISGKPEYVRKSCHDSLRRLNTDYIDLYYIHRVDMDTPIEETIGEMAKLVAEGKIKSIGLSEASAETLRRAHATHPVSALQSEYSMLTRDPEKDMLALTRELGITFVPYSPICRGLLSSSKVSDNDPADVRKMLPRFQKEAYENNKAIANSLNTIAGQKGCSLAQLSLAWIMAQSENIVPIPGTTKIKNLDSNVESMNVSFTKNELNDIDQLLKAHKVIGDRYTAEGMKGVNV